MIPTDGEIYHVLGWMVPGSAQNLKTRTSKLILGFRSEKGQALGALLRSLLFIVSQVNILCRRFSPPQHD